MKESVKLTATTMEESLPMKCRKCRFVLLIYPQTRVESSHGTLATEFINANANANAKLCSSEVWYIPEEHMPPWMSPNVEKGGWVKGKIQCPKCDARLGSYNFVSGMKCPCGSEVVAPIHIVKSKVDFFIAPPCTDDGTSTATIDNNDRTEEALAKKSSDEGQTQSV